MTRNNHALIEETLHAGRVPGLVAAVVGPEGLRSTHGFGVADLVRRDPVGEHTPFLWFSMTKIATATAVMRLTGLGQLDLDAPVSEFFPSFAMVRQHSSVTVRHLLNHSSGLTHRGGRLDVGLGWYRSAAESGPFVEHLGGGSGFWNAMRLYPDEGVGIVIMGNVTRYDHGVILSTLAASGVPSFRVGVRGMHDGDR